MPDETQLPYQTPENRGRPRLYGALYYATFTRGKHTFRVAVLEETTTHALCTSAEFHGYVLHTDLTKTEA